MQPGGPLTINTSIVNDGPATAGPFAVEFFLSTAQTWTPQSVYLGSVTVPTLAGTSSSPMKFRLP